jgi:hypothetical protein
MQSAMIWTTVFPADEPAFDAWDDALCWPGKGLRRGRPQRKIGRRPQLAEDTVLLDRTPGSDRSPD